MSAQAGGEPTATPGTPEDVELLARELMGWPFLTDHEEIGNAATSGAGAVFSPGRGPFSIICNHREWNPFVDANADVMVLERVREVWADREWIDGGPAKYVSMLQVFGTELVRAGRAVQAALAAHSFSISGGPLYAASYRTGDYARAAVAVLRSGAQERKEAVSP